jgi:Flp pilus assembly pilin Flp
MVPLLLRLIREDDAQDIVEYALLTASIGVMGIATWPLIAAGVGVVYQQLDTNTQSIWEVPDPGSAE